MSYPSLLALVGHVRKQHPGMSGELAISIGSIAQSAFEEADEGRYDLPVCHEPQDAISIAAEYLKFLAYGD